MKTQRLPSLALMAAVWSPLALTACVVAPSAPPPHAYYERVIVAAPPPPRLEVVGAAPYPGYVWIGGYWTWHAPSRSHRWVAGQWVPPRHGYRWEPHRWERHGEHWRERPGRWERVDDRRERRGF